MKKETQIKRFRDYLSKNDIEFDLVDLEHEIDGSLSFEENLTLLKEKLNLPRDINKEEEIQFYQEQREKIEKEALKQEQEDISQLSTAEPQIDQYYFETIHYIKMLVKGYSHALMYEGTAGLGKTHTVRKTLQQAGLKLGRDFAHLQGYATPLSLVQFLYEHRDYKIIFIDDCEGILTNERGKTILKGSLDKQHGSERIVQYHTTLKNHSIPSRFTLKAKVIICANKYPSDADFDAIKDRCLYNRIDFDKDTIIKILTEISKKPYRDLTKEQRTKVIDLITQHGDNTTTIRTYFKICDLMAYSPENYERLALNILKITKERALVIELKDTGKKVKDQEREFIVRTGKSRATFYNIRKSLK